MGTVGIIDYFLDNYHSKNYPEWIRTYSKGELAITCAYASYNNPDVSIGNREWSRQLGIPLVSSQEELLARCDYIMILAPSNPETHEELSRLALQSGKRVYVDKPFAPDLETAKRMFQLAEKYDTPLCSSSALAFVSDYEKIDNEQIHLLSSRGGGSFEVYTIHQFEPIISLMGERPKRIMSVGNMKFPSFVLEFSCGRIVKTEQFKGLDFEMLVGYKNGKAERIKVTDDLFRNFIIRVIHFFETGELVAEKEQTLSVIATLDAAKKALQTPLCWVTVDR